MNEDFPEVSEWTDEKALRLRILQSLSKTKISALDMQELEVLQAEKLKVGRELMQLELEKTLKDVSSFSDFSSKLDLSEISMLAESIPAELTPDEMKEWLLKISSRIMGVSHKLAYALYFQAEIKGRYDRLFKMSCEAGIRTSQWDAEAEAATFLSDLSIMLAGANAIVSFLQTIYYAMRLQIDTLKACLGLVATDRGILSNMF